MLKWPSVVCAVVAAGAVVGAGGQQAPTDSPQASQTLNSQMIESLSIVGRDAAELMKIMPGMGMTGGQLLRRVEIPLALPLVMAGVRTSAVQVVATATLAAVTAWGGLGRYIVDGYAVRDYTRVFAGAVLVAALALLADRTFAFALRWLPGGRRRPVMRAPNRPIA